MQTHYVIVIHVVLIVFISFTINAVFDKNTPALILFCSLLLIVNSSAWNINREKHPLQEGLNISDFTHAAKIIHEDNKEVYNVGMYSQGDNRAMPLRYALNLLNETPLHYDNYRDIDHLYFIVKKNKPIDTLDMWEYTSFGKSKIVKKWNLNEDYYLYKLERR